MSFCKYKQMEGRATLLLVTLVLLGFIRGKAFDFNLIYLALPFFSDYIVHFHYFLSSSFFQEKQK